MLILHQIGKMREARENPNFNTLGQIVASEGPISFDGVYRSVYETYQALKGKDITFFPSGKFVGRDNSFDVDRGQPLSKFCTVEEILEMADFLGAKIGYHGWAHLNCSSELMDEDNLVIEMRPPPWLIKSRFFNWEFAWPHGRFKPEAVRIARSLGYRAAWSTFIGDGTDYAKIRNGLGRD